MFDIYNIDPCTNCSMHLCLQKKGHPGRKKKIEELNVTTTGPDLDSLVSDSMSGAASPLSVVSVCTIASFSTEAMTGNRCVRHGGRFSLSRASPSPHGFQVFQRTSSLLEPFVVSVPHLV